MKIEQHPDKTFIGKIEKGFDFLGYHFSRDALRLAESTLKKHVERLHRLYEQQTCKNATSEEVAFILGGYVRRWIGWCHAGLSEIKMDAYVDLNALPLIIPYLIGQT